MELKLPELGENIETVDVSAVLVAEGDAVRRDQPVIEVETEKASLEVPSSCDGRVKQLLVSKGDKVAVGQVILVIETEPGREAAAAAPAPPAPAEPQKAEPQPPEGARDANVVAFPVAPVERGQIGTTVPAAPSVRALARELGLDIYQIAGSGPGGRITRDDVKAHAKRMIGGLSAGATAAGQAGALPLPAFSQWGEVERETLSAVRRSAARNLSHAWTSIPHVTQFDRADITRLEEMRRNFNERPEAQGRKLSVTALAVKLSAMALAQFPKFNASLDLAGNAIVYKRYYNVGVAVDTDRGLLVPVIRGADRKGVLEISKELGDLAERARGKKLRPEEMAGATFTVSNLGGLGTTHFSPIVNWPEVAILGIGRAEIQAVHRESAFEPRLILPLSVSYDHRLIDGADAARFLRWLAEGLEQPLLLLLDQERASPDPAR